MLDEYPFALCLTHDIDRPYKRVTAAYNAVLDRDVRQLKALLPGVEPYWAFEELMALEAELGVRSAFYVLNEQRLVDRPVREWLTAEGWRLYTDRYSLSNPDIVDLIKELHRGGWEIGLHGSYESYRNPRRFRAEKQALEATLGERVTGVRQHYLNLDIPDTWRMHAELGLQYDTSLGSSTEFGFRHGYLPFRPFDDEFVEFPLTLMEVALPNVERRPNRAWGECEALLQEAALHGAVMTVLWHPRYFANDEFPNYGALYRRLIVRALELGAWVGPPGELYERLRESNEIPVGYPGPTTRPSSVRSA